MEIFRESDGNFCFRFCKAFKYSRANAGDNVERVHIAIEFRYMFLYFPFCKVPPATKEASKKPEVKGMSRK